MNERLTQPLYRKQGRRYVPAFSECSIYDRDLMKVNTFHLVHAYESGGRRFEYEVTPETAAVVAGLMLYRDAVVKAIADRAIGRPAPSSRPYSKKQLAVIERFRAEMADAGGLLPDAWTVSSAYDIANAAMDAMRELVAPNTAGRTP